LCRRALLDQAANHGAGHVAATNENQGGMGCFCLGHGEIVVDS
jgi:hypothetical protein